jgi:hypothetical protein
MSSGPATDSEEANMSNPVLLILPFILAATRSLTLGIQSPRKLGDHPTTSAEREFELLTIVAFCLLGLLVTLEFMIRLPDLGMIIAEYNQF